MESIRPNRLRSALKRWWVMGGLFAGSLLMLHASDRRAVFLPGTTSNGHHLIENSCKSCHTPFETVKNESCTTCHRAELKRDIHSTRLFEDPRWVAELEKVNASLCVTCHHEHRIVAGGVTIGKDMCYLCHDDVTANRASHATLGAETCGNAGCHNYHDNQSLNTAFLLAHRGEPELRAPATLPSWRGPEPDESLRKAADTPATLATPASVVDAWSASRHAAAGVSCADCHGKDPVVPRPGLDSCRRCHAFEAETFSRGKHGARAAVEAEAVRPGDARLPMRERHAGQPTAMSCFACHDAHSVDTRAAATDACLQCHDDEHSRNFAGSPHALLAGANEASSTTAVTCATCHLPRETVQDTGDPRVAVNHNNSFASRPADRMARQVCMSCHGLEFALTSVLDHALVASNFRGKPVERLQTFSLIDRLADRTSGGGTR